MKEVFVLIHKGKHESVDSVIVKKFASDIEADKFIEEFNHPDQKYYTCCTKINLNQEYEVCGCGSGHEADCY